MVSANYGAVGYNPYDYMNIVQSPAQNQNTTQESNPLGISKKDSKALVDCYVSTPSESLGAAAFGGATFWIMNNPRFVAHPINTFKAFKGVNEMFKPVLTEGHQLNKLWVDPKTNSIMRDAHLEMHRAFARAESRLPIFRKKYDKKTLEILQKEMQRALDTGKATEIAKATERLRAVYVTDTGFGKAFRWIDKFSGGSPYKTQEEAIKNFNSPEVLNKATERIAKAGKLTFKDALKTHAGIGGIALFAGIEILMGLGNVKTAYQKDKENKQIGKNTNYGNHQLMQTMVKGLGSGIGWGVGEAVGMWAYGKWGAKLGSKGHPVIGTVLGGIVGLVGGSIGMMLTGRATKAMVGEDVGSKIEAKKLMETPEGQVQVLEQVYEKAKKGEANPAAVASLKKVLAQLQAQAQQAPIQMNPSEIRQAVRSSSFA